MHIIIKEENSFMPDTTIRIYENRIEYEENNKSKLLEYNMEEIRDIMDMFFDISKDWKDRYVDKGIIDDDIFEISIISNKTKTYYIKNKYPQNWGRFILFRNKLIREELKIIK